ncbi:MAG: DNA polymerase II, partial [Candidatus Hydrogenedentota bacterium]
RETMSDEAARQAMDVAEEAREAEWKHPSFGAGIFGGDLDLSLILPFPVPTKEDRAEGDAFLAELSAFLEEKVDGEKNDIEGRLPEEVLAGLKELGCFGMKIPKEYGGLGLSQVNYNRAIGLVASRCASAAVWLSAHQSIGVPQPLKIFGTEEQKKKYLPRLAKGAVSAFALTEPGVGSDPARMKTTATPTEDGKGYILEGEKLWCTNGPDAEIIVVMARMAGPEEEGRKRPRITAFIVETAWEGFEVVHRCEFMGIRAISNGLIRFNRVFVPRENILWEIGKGLKLALITLNTGRLTLPAACGAAARTALVYAREWSKKRVQWGYPIGKHDAIAGLLAKMSARCYAMDAVTYYTSVLADRGGADIRLEAAMAKLFASEESYWVADTALQIRGGRGYETSRSLRGRGEEDPPVERIVRDLRINRIIEGSTEIMHLFIAREALDPHMKAAGALANPRSSSGQKLRSFIRAGFHYALWYPARFIPPLLPELADVPDPLYEHALYAEAESRALARRIFYSLVRFGPKLEKRQRVLFRFVDVGTLIFAMLATIGRALSEPPERRSAAIQLADIFCRDARRRIAATYADARDNSDTLEYSFAQDLLDGKAPFLEEDILP